MAEISNRFFVTALDDGTTLHGNLTSDGSLTQAWNGTSAIPDWTQAANQPTIFLTLLNGSTLVTPADFTWYHDSVKIDFGDDGISTDKLFKKTTKSVSYGDSTLDMPALQIIGNIAAAGNVDSDTISIGGTYSITGAEVQFSASTQIRITQITANGYLGVIIFPNGTSDITAKNQDVQMYGVLYNNEGNAAAAKTDWYLNSSTTATEGVSITDSNGTTYANGFTVNEKDVVDHAMIRCNFVDDSGSTLYAAYAAVDDLTDPEFMYIQYNGGNGNAASLRNGETATFTMWVGKENDSTVDETYKTFKVQLVNSGGKVNTEKLDNINDVESADTGLRPLSVSGGQATISISYGVAKQLGKNVTGLVYAYSSTTTTTT